MVKQPFHSIEVAVVFFWDGVRECLSQLDWMESRQIIYRTYARRFSSGSTDPAFNACGLLE